MQPTTGEEILGIFLKDGLLFREHKHRLQTAMFGEYGWLYKVFLETDLEEIPNVRAVASRCREQAEVLHSLRNSVYSTAILPSLIEKLKKDFLRDKMREITRSTILKIDEGIDADDVLRDLQGRSFALKTTEIDGVVDPEKDVDDWYEWLQAIIADPSKAYGLMTGISAMDRLTTGWHRTDFIVIGARTSIGKTAFMLQNILNLTRAGYKCAIFSLEMIKRQLYNRMIANLAGIELEQMRSGRISRYQADEIPQHKEFLKQIYVDDSRGISADYIADSMRELKRTQGLDFVVVDYLQDVKEAGEQNDHSGSALARICRKLRAAAKESDCAIMGLSQVSREVERRDNKRPGVSDLSGSTGIETSADVIGMLYREDYYDPDTHEKDVMEVNFAKQRNGKVGMVKLHYVKDFQRILSI